MSEQSQEKILDRLTPYAEQIQAACKEGKTLFLLLGNAMELFGQYIQREDGSKVDSLGVFDTHTIRHAPNRFNTLIQASFENMTLLGYTSRFADTFGITQDNAFCRVEIGSGSDPKTKLEGIRSGRVIATYLLGPLLVANPDFTKWLLQQLGTSEPVLPFEGTLYLAYETKRKEFQRTDLELD
jgi:CobQ-like glutamine amidotransferase family enzyme